MGVLLIEVKMFASNKSSFFVVVTSTSSEVWIKSFVVVF